MTELERARAFLRQAQDGLSYYRKCAGEGIRNVEPCIRDNENCVLAALAWVWEEQEKQQPVVLHVAGVSVEDVKALQRALRMQVSPSLTVLPYQVSVA